MAVSRDYLQYVLEQLAGLGELRSQRMFGAAGLYCDEVFFAIVSDDTLYLRVDDSNREDFTARGMAPFRPYADRPDVSMTYYEVPAEVLEDGAALVSWARRSLAGAARSAPGQKPRRGRPRAARRAPRVVCALLSDSRVQLRCEKLLQLLQHAHACCAV